MSVSITYNGKTSESFGLIVTKIERPAPKKRLVRTKIPYSNYTPDFSRLTGRYTYDRRQLKYTFACKAASEAELSALISGVEEWLSEAPSGSLTESVDATFCYVDCTCDDISVEYISPRAAKIVALFTAYPYRRSAETQAQTYSVLPQSQDFTYTLTGSRPMRPLFTSMADEIINIDFGDDIWFLIPPLAVRYQLTPIIFSVGNNAFSAHLSMQPSTLKIECIDEVI